MIRKLLIANRGEIAVRIIRACREMGIATVAVYSEADEESLHTQLADEAICIGPGPSAQSYLNMEQIISATMVSGADAIHPGFGFLSENARFAELCEKCGITFVGPPSKVIRMLGNKKIARSTMIAAGVPVVPGSEGDVEDIETGLKEAERIGYPVIIKAALGGGGKGMRVANTPEEFPEAYATARKESEIAFGDGTMYIEHFVVNPRHIEFQILADRWMWRINKKIARSTMIAAGVPVVPGSEGDVEDIETGLKEAERIGYPVIIKAALGGGGKGMRVANTPEEFPEAYATARKESEIAFGDGTMYIEHFVVNPRHIEFQILADSFGNVIHLGERDCSIQRNHQKMIEESPSAAVSPELREKMGHAAVTAAKAAGYVNAGTIEFLLEPDGKFWFMEMNTRIQVEHPVTEWVTGIDLVKEQLKIASGMPFAGNYPGSAFSGRKRDPCGYLCV